VLEAMGAGHVPAALVPDIGSLAAAMPVVLATRVPGGRIFTRTYAFAGSEMDLAERGVVIAGHLAPAKAVQLLRLLLAQGARSVPIADQFARYAEARA